MNKLTLLVMAAGMGSRYGGLKQLDIIGPNNETIIDYSVYDAIKVGFTEIVFVIREDLENDFKHKISNKFTGLIKINYAYQDLDNLPNSFKRPNDRIKPWGTGQAILSAKKIINNPFVVINADDFYGRDSFQQIYNFYNNTNNKFCMVAYKLSKTLSDNGSVSRGVCSVNNNKLLSVKEIESIEIKNNLIKSNSNINLKGDEFVSMNMWGFTPKIFSYIENDFIQFLKLNINKHKSEFLIPAVVNNLLHLNIEEIDVLKTESLWFGVTYKEDKISVVNQIKCLIKKNIYNSPLY
tara:strand:+ start:100 stop:981 length:882 start_codon:yes stop_codon:yes gene_type:complete